MRYSLKTRLRSSPANDQAQSDQAQSDQARQKVQAGLQGQQEKQSDSADGQAQKTKDQVKARSDQANKQERAKPLNNMRLPLPQVQPEKRAELQQLSKKYDVVLYADSINLPKRWATDSFQLAVPPRISSDKKRYEYVYDHSKYGQMVRKLSLVHYKHSQVAQHLRAHVGEAAKKVFLTQDGVIDLKNDKQLVMTQLKIKAKAEGQEALSALYTRVMKGRGMGDKALPTLLVALLPLKYRECFSWPAGEYGQWNNSCKGPKPQQVLEALKQAKPEQGVALAVLFQKHANDVATQKPQQEYYAQASKVAMMLFSRYLWDVWKQGGGQVYSKYKVRHPYAKMKSLNVYLDDTKASYVRSFESEKEVEIKEARDHADSQSKVKIVYELKEEEV